MDTPMHLRRHGTDEHFLRQEDGTYVQVSPLGEADATTTGAPAAESTFIPFVDLREGEQLELVDPNRTGAEPAGEVYEDWQPEESAQRYEAFKTGAGLRVVGA